VVDSFEALYKKLNHLTQMTSDDRMLSKKELFSLLEQVLNQMDQLRNEYTKLLQDHLEELSRTYQEIATLFELNSMFASVVDPSEIFESLTQTLRQTVPFGAIIIDLTVLGKVLSYEKSFERQDLISRARRLLETVEGVVLIEPEHGAELKNLLSVPVSSGGTNWGRITLVERESGIFTAADRKILEAAAFQLAATCERYTRLWREIERQRIREQLEIAKRIQTSLLPKSLPRTRHFEIAAQMVPAIQVGGDYYDVISRGQRMFVTVADVSGKGIPAALLMTSLRSTLRALVKNTFGLSRLAEELNRVLCEDLEEDRFVTMALMCLHENGEAHLINAGHNPIVRVREGQVELLEARTLPMGIMQDVSYEETKFQLHSMDTLVIYTDGVTEARNPAGEEFGLERLTNAVKKCWNVSAEEMMRRIEDELKLFCGDTPQHDDSTLVVVKYLG
jgi:sigma-B regulation protein RsbU (phosphoserine phosphatase)